ncbi:MAG: hypothetical protein ABI588_07775 [Arenimonas sp.]
MLAAWSGTVCRLHPAPMGAASSQLSFGKNEVPGGISLVCR